MTLLIFTFKDFAFLIGENFNFCQSLFWCFHCASVCFLTELDLHSTDERFQIFSLKKNTAEGLHYLSFNS